MNAARTLGAAATSAQTAWETMQTEPAHTLSERQDVYAKSVSAWRNFAHAITDNPQCFNAEDRARAAGLLDRFNQDSQ